MSNSAISTSAIVRSTAFAALLVAGWMLGGCSAATRPAPSALTGFEARTLDAGAFDLAVWTRIAAPGQPITVYIEGDGRAWLDRYRPSRDPTPPDSLVRELALRDPGPNAAYLARPCQYTGGVSARNCGPPLWTRARYSEDVISAMDRAVSQLKAAADAPRVRLIGHSGGGTVAALLAARRGDVIKLVTVAGLLDVAYWVDLHGLSPLDGSLDPSDNPQRLRHLPQVHFAGGADDIVPPSVVRSYLDALGSGAPARMVVVRGYGHDCCWARDWPERLAEAG